MTNPKTKRTKCIVATLSHLKDLTNDNLSHALLDLYHKKCIPTDSPPYSDLLKMKLITEEGNAMDDTLLIALSLEINSRVDMNKF